MIQFVIFVFCLFLTYTFYLLLSRKTEAREARPVLQDLLESPERSVASRGPRRDLDHAGDPDKSLFPGNARRRQDRVSSHMCFVAFGATQTLPPGRP